jgi:hypothetical protein
VRNVIVTTAATVSGVLLLLSLKPHSAADATAGAPISTGSLAGSTSGGTAGSSGTISGATATPGPSTASGTAGGGSPGGTRSITGTAAQTPFGPVQVRITVVNGRITGVSVPEYPDGSRRDEEINTYALPVLNREAIAAQSARIDAVSGATFTSQGYLTSLQSAIDEAGL